MQCSHITVKAECNDNAIGSGVSGGGRIKRGTIVRDVMQKHGLSLLAASKYAKEHHKYYRLYHTLNF